VLAVDGASTMLLLSMKIESWHPPGWSRQRPLILAR